MNFAQWKTLHFWLDLIGDALALALVVLIFTGSHAVVLMGCLALALWMMKKAGVWTAAAWLPLSVRGKLSDNDLQSAAGRALLAVLDRMGVKLGDEGKALVEEVVAPAPEPAPPGKVVVTDIVATQKLEVTK